MRIIRRGRRDRRVCGRGRPSPAGVGRVVRRFSPRLRAGRRDASHVPAPGRVRVAAVRAERVPHQDVRQPLHDGHRAVRRVARRARQRHV